MIFFVRTVPFVNFLNIHFISKFAAQLIRTSFNLHFAIKVKIYTHLKKLLQIFVAQWKNKF